MNKSHKHAAVIKAWADGAEIECRYSDERGWMLCMPTPSWLLGLEYRVKPPPLVHQEWAEAFYVQKKDVQCRVKGTTRWHAWRAWGGGKATIDYPDTAFNNSELEFRFPPKVEVVFGNAPAPSQFQEYRSSWHNVKYTYEDGKLIKAEVL